jgi:hypothetical protein
MRAVLHLPKDIRSMKFDEFMKNGVNPSLFNNVMYHLLNY